MYYFGSCCLQPIMEERVRYDDNVRWTKYYALVDEVEDELHVVDYDDKEKEEHEKVIHVIVRVVINVGGGGCERCKKTMESYRSVL